MPKTHTFSFDGGEKLSKMGATWFIIYAYSDKINSNENRWRNIKTYKYRMSIYYATMDYHKNWYTKVTKMDTTRLNTNTFGVAGNEVKNMAQELFTKS